MNHSKDNSLRLFNWTKEHGSDTNLLFCIHKVSRSIQNPISSGILFIKFDAIFNFFNYVKFFIFQEI